MRLSRAVFTWIVDESGAEPKYVLRLSEPAIETVAIEPRKRISG
jgi:hypothetical protein